MRPALARIVDANLNRAREALRVLEEYARFALDDRAATGTLKSMRHALAAAARAWPAADLLAARDTSGDVGTSLSTPGERRRTSAADVVTAAAKRLSEALRAIEEYAKIDAPAAAVAVERLRYAAYDVEKRLVPRAHRPAFDRVRLYVLITASLCRRSWLETARLAIRGGADCLQLREKDIEDAERLDRAAQLVRLCHRHGVLCILNDRPDIARLAGADGVHVGQTDLAVADARAVLGPDRLVGKSTHNRTQFVDAIREQPDYVAFGPMYDTATKPQRRVPGPSALAKLPPCPVPLVAIGGITADNVEPIRRAGCDAVAVCSAIISQRDVTAAARRLRRAFLSRPARRSRRRRTKTTPRPRRGTTTRARRRATR